MIVLGLDLSTRAAAAVACPLAWDGDFSRIRSIVVGHALPRSATDHDRIARYESIARQLVGFARTHSATEAWFESPAYSRHATAAHTLGELGGIVRLRLMEEGLEVNVANMSSARKLMCGATRRGDDKKAIVSATLRQAGAPAELLASPDLCDAMTALNFGLSELGGFCFAQLPEAG